MRRWIGGDDLQRLMSERKTYQEEVDYRRMMRKKKEEKEARLEVENNDAGVLLEHPTITSPTAALTVDSTNLTGKLMAGDRSPSSCVFGF